MSKCITSKKEGSDLVQMELATCHFHRLHLIVVAEVLLQLRLATQVISSDIHLSYLFQRKKINCTIGIVYGKLKNTNYRIPVERNVSHRYKKRLTLSVYMRDQSGD